jgi:hypothetical protein
VIHVIRDEMGALKNGFNFYPLSSPHSFGFKLKLGRWVFRIRYSKISGHTYCGFYRAHYTTCPSASFTGECDCGY